MYARIIPLLRLPRSIGAFDYRYDDPLPLAAGSLVVVPFRRRKTLGVVAGVMRTSDIAPDRLLPVTGVMSVEPVLPRPQFVTAQRVASDNFCSPSTVFRSILPSFPLKTRLDLVPSRKQSRNDGIAAFLDSETGTHDEAVIVYHARRSLLDLYRRIAERLTRADLSTLIVVPTIAQAERIAAALDGTFLYHHSMSAVKRRSAFLMIRSARSSVVIGTRSALFAPLANLGAIVVDDEDADGHQQEEPNPRYDGRRVAAMLAKASGARLIFTSRLPTLALTQRYPVSRMLDASHGTRTVFIDLERQRSGDDYATVTDPAVTMLRNTVADGGTALVVHQRRSEFGSLECRDCGFVPSCTGCGTPYKQDNTALVCRHCASTVPVPARCPHCNGVSLRGRGRGVDHVVRELQTAGFDAVAPHDASENEHGAVTVLTVARTYELTDRSYDLIIVTRYESLLAVPRADADERARRLLVTLASNLRSNGMLVVQGSTAHRKEIETPDDGQWRTRTLELRDRFGYPPAWKVLVLRQRKTRDSSHTVSMETVFKRLSQFQDMVVTPPQRSHGRSKQNPTGTMLIVRTKKELAAEVHALLATLDESWTIAVNPAEIA